MIKVTIFLANASGASRYNESKEFANSSAAATYLIKARNDFAPSKISDKVEVIGADLWDTKANAIIRRVRTLAAA